MSDNENLLIVADTKTNADLYYATGFLVDITVAYVASDGKKTLLVNDLEYGRAGLEAKVDEVLATSPYEERLRSAGQSAGLINILDLFLKERGISEVVVPSSIAFGYGKRLEELGYRLQTREEPFFAERTVKSAEELAAIEETQGHIEDAMAFAVDTLRQAKIDGSVLRSSEGVLTSEHLRLEIQKFLLDRECLATEVIVAGGDQGADPHRRGSGPLPAHTTIILDIFGRSLTTRYWGDMTRTVVRGKASEAVRKLYTDVLEAQEVAFGLIRDGCEGREVHKAVADFLAGRGNCNGEENGKKTGFFHGTGHGVGLDIHEVPRVGRISTTLATGQTLTVEPGLYYPGIGAVRLEDIVEVTEDGCRNLNHFEKVLEI